MPNASSVSRVSITISSATPTVKWPNYGDVMHDAWLDKKTGYGTELSSAAKLTPPHYGTDVPSGGGVKQNVASYTFNRNCQNWQKKGKSFETKRYYSFVNQCVVEHYPDRPCDRVGISFTIFSNARLGTRSGKTGGAYASLVYYYKTANDPNTLKSYNCGQVLRFGSAWTEVEYHSGYDTILRDSNGITYVKAVLQFGSGADDYHAIGTYGPSSWSPERIMYTAAHPVGVSSNYWRTINGNNNESPIIDRATFYFKATEEDLNSTGKILVPEKVESGNGSYSHRIRRYKMSYWSTTMP